MNLKNKKVLLVGLGLLGGGKATADFLLKQGAKLTITDLKKKEELEKVLKKFKNKKINFVLEKHQKTDFEKNEIIVFNPAVGILSPWVKLAQELKKQIENDLTLFLSFLKEKEPKPNYIAVTGTRGKTTTSLWISHFLPKSILGGNVPSKGLLKIIKNKTKLFVLELSSFQLEFMKKNLPAPHIAVITNLYIDHLNRHKTLKNYIKAKAKIFLNQTKDDFLILNADNQYTKEFLKYKPQAKIYFFSLNPLPYHQQGLYFQKDKIFFKEKEKKELITNVKNLSSHQKYNLLAALLASYLYNKNWEKLINKIKSLPSPKFRQETVLKNKRFTIINDSAATSPEATIAALQTFKKQKNKLVLIAGGTDKNLKFNELAQIIKKLISKKKIFLLEGSATKKLVEELKKNGYFKKEEKIKLFKNLNDILTKIKKEIPQGIILFSPASASFEKFKNEFDRGKKFNKLVEKIF